MPVMPVTLDGLLVAIVEAFGEPKVTLYGDTVNDGWLLDFPGGESFLLCPYDGPDEAA